MAKLFTVLKFKNDRTKLLGRYALPIKANGNWEWGGCDIPQLMTDTTTIKDLQKIYPKLDFKEIYIEKVKLSGA